MILSRAKLLWSLMLALTLVAGPAEAKSRAVLIFSHTTGYRHASIEVAVPALETLVRKQGMVAVRSEDPSMFAPDRLRQFAAIIFLNSTTNRKDAASEWLVGARRAALEEFVRGGGGIVGIHAAADSHFHWDWYGRLIGARFARHPKGTPQGRLSVAPAKHPATRSMPAMWDHVDEYYYFDDYDPTSILLLTFDPASIGEKDVNPNPVSWARTYAGGRIFYTALGHEAQTYANPVFLRHVAEGLKWVVRR